MNSTKNEYFSIKVHVKDQSGSQPICRQVGPDLTLTTAEAFKKIHALQQCGRCRRALGIERYPGELRIPLSSNQRLLIKKINKRTETPGQWIPVAELCEDKSSSGRTSTHRSLRHLQARGYIEKKTEKAKSFVRLANKTTHG